MLVFMRIKLDDLWRSFLRGSSKILIAGNSFVSSFLILIQIIIWSTLSTNVSSASFQGFIDNRRKYLEEKNVGPDNVIPLFLLQGLSSMGS